MKRIYLLFLVIFSHSSLFAQGADIRGTVRSQETSEPMAGVSVTVKGTNTATATNAEGTFVIRSATNPVILVVHILGYKTQEVAAQAGQNLNILLEEDINVLEEVVAIGYGTARRRDLTGAVSSIGADKIAEVPVASAMEAIQGRLPGVNVSVTEGSPDAELRIRVRGGGSLTQDNSPLYIVDGFPATTIADIAPSDIESIDVLKDIASASIYGSRGANGVIIITTKTGKAGRFSVNFNSFGGPKRLAKTLDVLSPYDYALWQYERSLLDNSPTDYTNYFGNWQDIDLYQEIQGNDWQKLTFGRTGNMLNNNLSVMGGSEKTRYSVSYNNVSDKAIMEMSSFKRDNLTLRLNSKPYKNLTLDLALRYSNTRINGGGTNEQNEVSSADSRLKFAMIYPTIPIAGLTDDAETDQDFALNSPLVSLADNDRFQRRTNYNLNASIAWNITDVLQFKTEGSLDYGDNINNRFYGLSTYYVRNSPPGDYHNQPAVIMEKTYRPGYRSTNILNYDFRNILGDIHKLNLMVGQEYTIHQNETLTSTVHGLPTDFGFEQSVKLTPLGKHFVVDNNLAPDDKMFSLFSRLSYDYNGKYLVNAVFRADASSKFARENRWGYFPSVSAAWRVSAEPFMAETQSWLDDLKLRASYGTGGNNRIKSGLLLTEFSPSTTTWVNGYNSYWSASKTMANPDLKWETTISRNIGLDYTVAQGLVTGAIEFYSNNTKDLLIEFPVFGTGYDQQFRNIGETQNRGIELSANVRAINKEKFGLDIGANIAFNRSKILDLGGLENILTSSGWASTEIPHDYWAPLHGQVGEMYGYRSAGRYEVDDFERYDATTNSWILKEGVADATTIVGRIRPGSMKLQDLVGDDHRITIDDREIIGNANPLHTGGFNVNVRLHSFDIGTIFSWNYGNDIYNANKIEYTSTSKYHSRNLISTMAPGERWTNLLPDGTISNDPTQLAEMNQNTNLWSPYMARYIFSDWAVEDGSFLRLNTLTLGYNIPKLWLAKAKIQSLRLYTSAYNVFTWTNYSGFDPEVSTRRKTQLTPGVDYSAYPRSRMIVFGLNLSL